MARFNRPLQALTVIAAILATASCTTTDPTTNAPSITRIPGGAVGFVSLGPSQPPFDTEQDRTTLYAFDNEGSIVGKFAGNALYDSQILTHQGQVEMSFSDSVFTLTDSNIISTPINENMIQAAVEDPNSAKSTMWFNSGYNEGKYINRFISKGPDGEVHQGEVPGLVLTSSYCGGKLYAIVQNGESVGWDRPYSTWLYEINPGQDPLIKGIWDYPNGLEPASRVATCSTDGKTMIALYASSETRSSHSGDPGLIMVKIETTDGSRKEFPLEMTGYEWYISRGAMTVKDDVLYWATVNGNILSVPISGETQVTSNWNLPSGGLKSKISISGDTVAQIDYQDSPKFLQFNLFTGDEIHAAIELPWMKSLIGSSSQSGKSYYTVTDVAGSGQWDK